MEKSQPPPYSGPAPEMGFVHQPGMPQAHPGYPPHPQAPPTTVIVTNVHTAPIGPQPCSMVCPSCHAQITTSVETHANTKTHLFAFLCCLFGCWICCCLPYCMDSCQSQTHTCPNCRAYIGEYNN